MLSIHKQNLENVITPFHSSFVAPGLKKKKKYPNQNSTSWAKYAYKNLQTKTEIVETAMLQPLSHLKQTKKAIWLSEWSQSRSNQKLLAPKCLLHW